MAQPDEYEDPRGSMVVAAWAFALFLIALAGLGAWVLLNVKW